MVCFLSYEQYLRTRILLIMQVYACAKSVTKFSSKLSDLNVIFTSILIQRYIFQGFRIIFYKLNQISSAIK